MCRIGALIIAVILACILWMALDWNGDSPSDAPGATGPARPVAEKDLPDPPPEKRDPGAPVSIRGHVVAPGGGRAAGSRVRPVALGKGWWPLGDPPHPEVRADAFGRFRLHGLEPGFYRIEARTDAGRGYLPVVPVRAGAETAVVVRLAPIASISGFVVTEAGVPVAGAKVSADLGGVLRSVQASAGYHDPKASGQFVAVTDTDGNFHLGDLPVGQYEIQVESADHAPRRVPAVNAPVKGIRIEVLDTFEVWGTVDWERDARPASIQLSVEPLGLTTTIRTDEHPAEFRLAGVTRGEHTFRAFSPDYGMIEEKFSVLPGSGTGPIRLTLKRGTQVWLRVKTGKGKEIAANVDAYRVERDFQGDRLVRVAGFPVTEAWRNKVFLTPGEWVLRGRAPGWKPRGAPPRGFSPEEYLWVDELVTWHDVILVPAAALVGRVKWPSGWPARGVPVEVNGKERVRTDPRGEYRWDGIRRGEVRVRVDGQERTVTSTEESPVVRADFVLRVEGTGTVRGQVISDENRPVPGATVFFRDGFTVTDIDGRFERENVAAGPHDLRYFAPGYGLGYRPNIRVEKGRTVEVPIMVLPWRSSRVLGRVLSSSDAPVSGARVRVWFPGLAEPLETRTDAGGWFVQEGPEGGEASATIQVEAPGMGFDRRHVAARSDSAPLEIRLLGTGRMRILLGSRMPTAFRLFVELRAQLTAGGTLPQKEFVIVVPKGVEHVDFRGLPPGKYRSNFFLESAKKRRKLKATNDRFRLSAGGTAEVGPLTLDR